jgi:2-polyprenyl-3-methyl-5-hydroxy-6-metoxy-1,4-benzoquinol methylase
MSDPCPLCRSTRASLHAVAQDIEYFTSSQKFHFFRCEACDVLFVSPMLHDRLDEIYPDNYYSFRPGKAGLVQRAKLALDQRMFGAILRQIPGPSLAVLDVGGGTGWLLGSVMASDPREMVAQIVDIDPLAKGVAEKAGYRYFLGPIEKFETEKKYDLILMLNLIEHVRRPDEVLAKARSMLSRNGSLLIKTPNFMAWDARLFRHRSWGGYHAPRHFVLFNRDSFTRLACAQGLRVASFSYTQGAPFWTASAINELRLAGLVKVSRERPSIYHPLVPLLQLIFAGVDFIRRPFADLSQMFFILKRNDHLTPLAAGGP